MAGPWSVAAHDRQHCTIHRACGLNEPFDTPQKARVTAFAQNLLWQRDADADCRFGRPKASTCPFSPFRAGVGPLCEHCSRACASPAKTAHIVNADSGMPAAPNFDHRTCRDPCMLIERLHSCSGTPGLAQQLRMLVPCVCFTLAHVMSAELKHPAPSMLPFVCCPEGLAAQAFHPSKLHPLAPRTARSPGRSFGGLQSKPSLPCRVHCACSLHTPLQTLQKALRLGTVSPAEVAHVPSHHRGPTSQSQSLPSRGGHMPQEGSHGRELALALQQPGARAGAQPTAANGNRSMTAPAGPDRPDAFGLDAWLRLAGLTDRDGKHPKACLECTRKTLMSCQKATCWLMWQQ